MTTELVLNFDPNTIEHLGISLYSQLPSVISELVSNSWDADALNIFVHFIDDKEDKEIIFEDDGHGMSFEELNEQYLIIGRNRRSTGKQCSPNGRSVIGKKGLGKLAVFGICDEIEVTSIKDNLINTFTMNLHDIKNSKNSSYKPISTVKNHPIEQANGTKIILKKVRRKTHFNIDEISIGLSKKFTIFDQINVSIQHNGSNKTLITNELKFSGFKEQFSWKFPFNQSVEEPFNYKDKIRGKIITLETPVKDPEMRGVYLTSRGKIVNSAEFYGLRDNDQFHSYVTGYLSVDFIDELSDDVISTDRNSLNWEHDITRELKVYIQSVIKIIGKEWRIKRKEVKKIVLKNTHDVDVDEWQKGLPTYERELSEKIVNPILESSSIDLSETIEIISNVINKFDNQDFKKYASNIADLTDNAEDIAKMLQLLTDWKLIEIKQYSDLAQTRIQVINKFEEHINNDTKEVPTLHNFLKDFSWLIDPRILEFKDEVTYSQILKETYPESALEEENRRIDFLCSNALGNILYIVEIKRSKYCIDEKALEQAYQYSVFIEEKYATETGFSKVVCFVIGGQKSSNPMFRKKEKTYIATGEVFVKTYRELLEQSKQYHKEFIEKHNEINSLY